MNANRWANISSSSGLFSIRKCDRLSINDTPKAAPSAFYGCKIFNACTNVFRFSKGPYTPKSIHDLHHPASAFRFRSKWKPKCVCRYFRLLFSFAISSSRRFVGLRNETKFHDLQIKCCVSCHKHKVLSHRIEFNFKAFLFIYIHTFRLDEDFVVRRRRRCRPSFVSSFILFTKCIDGCRSIYLNSDNAIRESKKRVTNFVSFFSLLVKRRRLHQHR